MKVAAPVVSEAVAKAMASAFPAAAEVGGPARLQWHQCLGAVGQALILAGVLKDREAVVAFYRAAGLEIHD